MVVGGLHLSGAANEQWIDATIDDLARFRLDCVVPAHCTGYRAVHRLIDRFRQSGRANPPHLIPGSAANSAAAPRRVSDSPGVHVMPPAVRQAESEGRCERWLAAPGWDGAL